MCIVPVSRMLTPCGQEKRRATDDGASSSATTYVPNDVRLTEHERCIIITGPNMGGKSSYIRQVRRAVCVVHDPGPPMEMHEAA